MSRLDEQTWHRDLQCCITSIDFPAPGVVRLTLPGLHCTDMGGAIKFARAITRGMKDFALWRVWTTSAHILDTVYEKDDGGKWTAYSSRRKP